MRKLKKDERDALSAVVGGGDVYDYGVARTLRKLQREFPDLVDIGEAMLPPKSPKARQPYFGAMTTLAGQEAINRR